MSWEDREWNRPEGAGAWGGGRSSFRENPMGWAPTIGSLFGIRIQIHILFLIYIAIELLRSTAAEIGFWPQFRFLGMLFGIVLLHEFGHCFGARYVGGSANRILMWPLGGLAYVAPPHRANAHLLTAAAGPLVNVVFCVVSAAVLAAGAGTLTAIPWNPFAYYAPLSLAFAIIDTPWMFWVYQFFYVNYFLLLFNLIPSFPLDGGQMFQAVCWRFTGYRRSMLIATTVGMVGAIALGCIGLFTQNFLLIGIAVFGYLTTMQQRRMAQAEPAFGEQEYDLSAAYDNPHRPKPERGRARGAWTRKQKRQAEDQAEVDRILEKVHVEGLNSLSRREKKTLARATERQREREKEMGRIDRF